MMLGGGKGFNTGMYGFAIDNLISARIVIASGELLSVSKEENPDVSSPNNSFQGKERIRNSNIARGRH